MKIVVSNLMMFFVALVSIALVSCSTNTQRENTGIGVATGAVAGGLAGSLIGGGAGKVVAVGVGAVAGALLGGYIGHSMDSSDKDKMNSAMTNNPTNKATTWKNSSTGTKYTVAPTSSKMTVNGNPDCRRYYSTAIIDGKKQKVSGIACQQADGTWQAVNS
jgi:surface antigen